VVFFTKTYEMLQNWEDSGDALTNALEIEKNNRKLIGLQTLLQEKIQKEHVARQKRERRRAKHIESLKKIWKH